MSGGGGSGGGDEDEDEAWDAMVNEARALVAADEEFVAVGLALTPGGVILGTLSYTDIPAVINCN
jgi:hypothetical protein